MANERGWHRAVRLIRLARTGGRMLTASSRVLPDFIIIGAQKAGTTSLFAYLTEHPDVRPGLYKEVHFFDLQFDRGERWYRSVFPQRRSLARPSSPTGRTTAITGEASPYYLFHPLAAERAAQVSPQSRLIVLLRDPIARAWSHYRHEVAAGREQLSFEDAIAAEPERLRGAEEAVRSNGPEELCQRHRNCSYVSRGRYAEQLAPWLRLFPRERILILRAEDLFADPAASWSRVQSFLDLPAHRPREFAVHNLGPGGDLPPATRAALEELYREPDRQLVELLGPEFQWERTVP